MHPIKGCLKQILWYHEKQIHVEVSTKRMILHSPLVLFDVKYFIANAKRITYINENMFYILLKISLFFEALNVKFKYGTKGALHNICNWARPFSAPQL